MTEVECRTHLQKLTVEQRTVLDTQTGHGLDPTNVEQIVGVLKRTPELERWIVPLLNEMLGSDLKTEAEKAHQATLEAAAYQRRGYHVGAWALAVAILSTVLSVIALVK